ncbi:MAG: hypothetical protein AAFN13_08440, partial [Bacteroidota bacterium]
MHASAQRHSRALVFAGYGLLAYGLTSMLCVVILFGYEEQFVGPPETFYTFASMTWVEALAYG